MSYATPNFTSFLDIFTYMNTVTGNVFGYLLLGSFFLVAFLSLKGWPTERAFLASIVFTLIVGVMLAALSIVNPAVITVLVLLTGIAIIFSGRDE